MSSISPASLISRLELIFKNKRSGIIFREQYSRSSIPWESWCIRGTAFLYLSVLLVIPMIVIFEDGLSSGIKLFWDQVTMPTALAAMKLTLWTAAVMAIINTGMGTITAYVLVRYHFPAKAFLNSIIDLPVAIPTFVTGVMFVVLFGPQQALGAWLKSKIGISIIFAPPGVILALLFITFPFVVRAVQPALMNLDQTQEVAAATLGADAWTIFRRITLPPLILPIVSGTLLCFARAIGEFGAVVIVAGNIPFYSQTTAVYVFGEVESENRLGASAVSVVMIAIAFGLLMIIDFLQTRSKKE